MMLGDGPLISRGVTRGDQNHQGNIVFSKEGNYNEEMKVLVNRTYIPSGKPELFQHIITYRSSRSLWKCRVGDD